MSQRASRAHELWSRTTFVVIPPEVTWMSDSNVRTTKGPAICVADWETPESATSGS